MDTPESTVDAELAREVGTIADDDLLDELRDQFFLARNGKDDADRPRLRAVCAEINRRGLFRKPTGTFESGQPVWFTKSMRLCTVVEGHADGTYTVERVDTGKRMMATKEGLKPAYTHP